MFTFILKVTDACNLRCKYCSVGDKKEFNIIGAKELNYILNEICEFSINKNLKNISVIFHGGEPLLLNYKIYDEVLDNILQKYSELSINYKIQTNGLLISDNFIEIFKKYDFSVGVSIDGYEEVHNKQRIDEIGTGNFKLVQEKILQLKKNNISCAALMVQTKLADKNKMDFLKWFDDNGISLKINPLICCGEACKNQNLYLSVGDYGEFLVEAFKYILKEELYIEIAPISSIINSIISKENLNECTFSDKCCKNFLCIDYDMSVYPCGRFSDSKTMKLGNLKEHNLLSLHNSGIRIKLEERKSESLPLECEKCRFKKLCKGGCPAEAQINGNVFGKSNLCYDYKIFFEYMYSDGLELLIKFLEMKKSKLMKKLK